MIQRPEGLTDKDVIRTQDLAKKVELFVKIKTWAATGGFTDIKAKITPQN